MKKWIFGLLAAAVAGLLAVFVIAPGIFGPSATPSSSSTPSVTRTGATGVVKVLATTNVWGDIAKQLGGDWVEVTVILDDPMQDPHSYEASARDQLAVNDAELIVMNGGGYDDFIQYKGEAGAKEAGKLRQEGKEYVVQDGDVLMFKFNV